MNVPLESERHPQSSLLAKSPIALNVPVIQQIADYKLALNMQKEFIRTANEETYKFYKHKKEQKQRLLDEYYTTYDDNFPSLTIVPLSP